MKILIVEDEPKTGEYLRQGLSEAGYVADLVPHGTDGLHMALHGAYDLVILDVMLPGLNGWQVLQSLRERGLQMPVLFLTARDQVEDRVKGLELGADDYLVKPFSFAELLARVRIILRRGPAGNEGTMLRVADLELDLLRRRVSRNGKRVDLTAKEFGLLELLMRRHGEVLPRSLIASQVWDMNFDSDTNVIEVAMRRLRMKIDEGHSVKLIQTVSSSSGSVAADAAPDPALHCGSGFGGAGSWRLVPGGDRAALRGAGSDNTGRQAASDRGNTAQCKLGRRHALAPG